jgi:hypothetical protein
MRKKDFWIERYIPWLAARVSPGNPQLREARRAYARFQQRGDERLRHEVWQHLHAAADEVGRRRAPGRRAVEA